MRAAFTLLVGFSGLSVALSFAGSDLLGPVTGSPAGARLGVFALTVAFTALVWERDRGLRRTAEQLTTERMLTSALESRLRALEALIAAGDRLDVPLAMDDALRIVLEGAIDISGAAGGAVEVVADHADVALIQSHRRESHDEGDVLRIPLEASGVRFGVLELTPPETSATFEPAALDALHRLPRTQDTADLRGGLFVDSLQALDPTGPGPTKGVLGHHPGAGIAAGPIGRASAGGGAPRARRQPDRARSPRRPEVRAQRAVLVPPHRTIARRAPPHRGDRGHRPHGDRSSGIQSRRQRPAAYERPSGCDPQVLGGHPGTGGGGWGAGTGPEGDRGGSPSYGRGRPVQHRRARLRPAHRSASGRSTRGHFRTRGRGNGDPRGRQASRPTAIGSRGPRLRAARRLGPAENDPGSMGPAPGLV